MERPTIIGKRVTRTDSLAKATGAAKYTADLTLPGMLYGKCVRTPYPHARILNIDLSKAQRLPGVRAVLTGKDTAGRQFGVYPEKRDQQLLTVEKVLFVGEEVAAVAAIDPDIAEEAVSLIEVAYEPLPSVMDPVAAMKEDAPLLHDKFERNIGFKVVLEFGDPDAGFRDSDYIREDRFTTSKVYHGQMEPYSALAYWDPSGKLELWMPNQSPFTRRKALSNALMIPLNKIIIHNCYMGGTFGGRSDTFPAEFCAALLSMKSGRPVRIDLTAEETIAATRHKHSMIIDLKTGVKQDGTIMARDIRAILDGGAYLSSGPMATKNAWCLSEPIYRNPNIRYAGYRVYTNKTPCSMMRTHPSRHTGRRTASFKIRGDKLRPDREYTKSDRVSTLEGKEE
jgi:4-hydroxybenzoyl-CoA reductase subunit alpha